MILNQKCTKCYTPSYISRMNISIEFPFLFALLYPSLNILLWYPILKPKVEKEIEHENKSIEGIEIEDYHTNNHQPIYLNINGFPLLIPLGGGTTTDYKYLLSKHISTDKKKEYNNYRQIDDKKDISISFRKDSHINSYSALVKIFEHYNIPEDNYKISLPLKVKYYHYKDGLYLHKTGFVASNKDKLIKKILHTKRLPFTTTIPTIAGFVLLLWWANYGDKMDYKYYSVDYPPFHYKRIIGYFK